MSISGGIWTTFYGYSWIYTASSIVEWTTLGTALWPSLLLDHLPRQLHQILGELHIIGLVTALLDDAGRCDVQATLGHHRGRVHGAYAALKLGFLERRHQLGHAEPEQRVRFMDVRVGLGSINDTRMGRVDQDVLVLRVQVLVQVLGMQQVRQLRSRVQTIWAEVLVPFLHVLELGIGRCALMEVGRHIDDADGPPAVSGLLEDGQQVRGDHDVSDVIGGQMQVRAVLIELARHDAPRGVIDEDVDVVGLGGDLVCDLGRSDPIRLVDLEVYDLVPGICSKLFLDCLQGILPDLLPHGGYEELGDALAQKGMDTAIADT